MAALSPRPVRPVIASIASWQRGPGARVAGWLGRPGGPWRAALLRHQTIGRLALAAVATAVAGCVPAGDSGDLAPTLSLEDMRGGSVAVQNGIPVPTFAEQDRPRIDLSGVWQHEITDFDTELSLTPREHSLDAIVAEAGGRERPDYQDGTWAPIDVPGTLNPIPDRVEKSGWYRTNVRIPGLWRDRTITLKFGAANYIADVWLNGVWLGYHEGGTTPFAFDATSAALPGHQNVLAVRVDNPPWGTRNDIVPWGLADWWNFGGLTRPVWLEASSPTHAVRADVVPHLDGADVSVVVRNAGPDARNTRVAVEIYPATVTDENLLDPAPSALVGRATPLARQVLEPLVIEPAESVRLDAAFLLADAATWSPRSPALHVARVTVSVGGRVVDELHETFGLRQVAVDSGRPAVTLNGQPVALPGVALHDQQLSRDDIGPATGVIPDAGTIREQLLRAQSVGARLIRAGHAPPNPVLLDLTDRLGFAVWEEIPLYHYTPQTFEIAMGRGIPQQMLREMALRDMNRPSVLFHGLANESTGEAGRATALAELHEIDRAIDGTRLTGQAAYGFNPADATSAALDVNGFTFYHGVFYGSDPRADTAAALRVANATFPDKPIMALEFGRWADGPGGASAQRRIFEETSAPLLAERATRPGGSVSAAVWWTLEDYATLRPNIEVEHFGLFRPDGSARPVVAAAREVFGRFPDNRGADPGSPVPVTARGTAADGGRPVSLLLGYIVYGIAAALALLATSLLVLAGRGGHSRAARRGPTGVPGLERRRLDSRIGTAAGADAGPPPSEAPP